MKEEYFIDFDGVILDTQVEIDRLFYEHGGVINEDWDKFLKYEIDWERLLNDSKVIDDSLNILKTLYKNDKKVSVFSRVFSLREAQSKLTYLRDNNVLVDFVICPGRTRKSEVIVPNINRFLVEDSISNAMDWKDNNGVELFFTKKIEVLKQLLKLVKYVEYDRLESKDYLDYLRSLVNSIDGLKDLTVSDDTKKEVIALKNITNLNNIELLDEIDYNYDTFNYCNNLSVLTKRLK